MKMSNFIKEVTARLKGDEQGVLAAKIERKASSAIKSQIAALTSHIVDAESAVEEAEERLQNAIYPTEMITNNNVYIAGIKAAKENLDEKLAYLTDVKESLTYFEGLLESQF
jgi:Tfp pilus assembly protein PilX